MSLRWDDGEIAGGLTVFSGLDLFLLIARVQVQVKLDAGDNASILRPAAGDNGGDIRIIPDNPKTFILIRPIRHNPTTCNALDGRAVRKSLIAGGKPAFCVVILLEMEFCFFDSHGFFKPPYCVGFHAVTAVILPRTLHDGRERLSDVRQKEKVRPQPE